MKCPFCSKGEIKKKTVDYSVYGMSLGKFEAETCGICRDEWFSEKTARQIEAKAKKEGVWGLGAKTLVAKSGNSLSIRVSKKIAEFMKLKTGEEVFVHPEGKKKIVVEVV